MHTRSAGLRNLCLASLDDARSAPADELDALAQTAKAHAARTAVQVCEDAIQLHGGMGFTTENPVSWYYRRALALRSWYGDDTELNARMASDCSTGHRRPFQPIRPDRRPPHESDQADPERLREETEAGHWAGNLVDGYLRDAAERTPKVAVVDRHGPRTYGDVDRTVNRLASALAGRGVGAGDVVSWMLPNWFEAIVVHLAVMRLGAVRNPIIPIYRHRESAFILRQAASKVVVVPDEFRGFDYPAMIGEIRPDVPDLELVVVVGTADGAGDHLEFADLLAEVDDGPFDVGVRDANDIALLLYTSGTTSASPKGALHSHNTLDYENRSMIDFLRTVR